MCVRKIAGKVVGAEVGLYGAVEMLAAESKVKEVKRLEGSEGTHLVSTSGSAGVKKVEGGDEMGASTRVPVLEKVGEG
jgi:hypothetical protein